MSRITVITLTLNEAHNIGPCLESVRWADEILVIDSGSTDDTVPRARAYTPHIFSITWQGYGAARNYALEKATGEWILWLDADERVTPELAGEIRQILQEDPPEIDGFSIARRAYFLGRWIRHSGWYPGRVTRLFRRGKGSFSESRVHEQLRLDGTVVQTKHDLLHLTDPDLAHYMQKFNKYTTLAAQDMAAAGRTAGLTDMTLRPAFQFFKMYVLRLGLLDGKEGFILAVLSSAYVFTKYAKLWELTRGRGQGRS
jgi:(heptosyl)LPS beta-1,4-glucosyltransferase